MYDQTASGAPIFENGAKTAAFARLFNEEMEAAQTRSAADQQCNQAMCIADPSTKTYPGPNGSDGEKTWYGRTQVQVRALYTCVTCGQATKIYGVRTVSFFVEDGYELAPYGVPYDNVWNPMVNEFTWVANKPTWFNPTQSDVPELVNWATKFQQ